MKQFPTAAHLVSWAGLCPQLRESAGKRRAAHAKRGPVAEARARAGRLGSRAQERLVPARAVLPTQARRGPKKAIVAVAASMLKAAFHMLRDGCFYQDLGGDHFDKAAKERATKRLVRVWPSGCTRST